MMPISDLATAIHLGLRMCILVFNDAAYGAKVHYYRKRGFSTDIVTFPETDFAAIAAVSVHEARSYERLLI